MPRGKPQPDHHHDGGRLERQQHQGHHDRHRVRSRELRRPRRDVGPRLGPSPRRVVSPSSSVESSRRRAWASASTSRRVPFVCTSGCLSQVDFVERFLAASDNGLQVLPILPNDAFRVPTRDAMDPVLLSRLYAGDDGRKATERRGGELRHPRFISRNRNVSPGGARKRHHVGRDRAGRGPVLDEAEVVRVAVRDPRDPLVHAGVGWRGGRGGRELVGRHRRGCAAPDRVVVPRRPQRRRRRQPGIHLGRRLRDLRPRPCVCLTIMREGFGMACWPGEAVALARFTSSSCCSWALAPILT